MRFCKKTKEVIASMYKTATVEEIVAVLSNLNLRKRKVENLQKYINVLLEKDRLKEENRLKFEKWALANPLKYRARTLVSGAKQRAKAKNIPFDLDTEWLINKLEQGRCEVTGTQFYIKPYSKRSNTTKVHPNSPSLDQIEPSAGYTKDNVQVVCDQYNKFKGDRHEVSTVRMARKLIESYTKRHQPVIKI